MKAQKHTLLIIDDDEDQRFFCKRAFEALGTEYKVQLASNGNEAIDYLQGQGKYADRTAYEFPSYILTDLQMPDGDGFAVLEFIKKNPALSIIPVVMLSTSQDQDDIRHAYLLGASSYFVTPPSVEGLKKLLKNIHNYWVECEVRQVDTEGYALATESRGKPGARFPKPAK